MKQQWCAWLLGVSLVFGLGLMGAARAGTDEEVQGVYNSLTESIDVSQLSSGVLLVGMAQILDDQGGGVSSSDVLRMPERRWRPYEWYSMRRGWSGSGFWFRLRMKKFII